MMLFEEGKGKKIKFSFSHCKPTKKFNLIKSNDYKIEIKLFDVLRKFENMSIYEIHQIPHEKGWTPDNNEGSESYDFLKSNFPGFVNYYHFRISERKISRVFVGTDGESEIIYILFVDGAGKMHHK